jgi:hypothetical protein
MLKNTFISIGAGVEGRLTPHLVKHSAVSHHPCRSTKWYGLVHFQDQLYVSEYKMSVAVHQVAW